MHLLGIISFAFILTSCGSYQYVGSENDAIYGDSERQVESSENTQNSDDSRYYENYFKEKTEQYGNIASDDDVKMMFM